ncbi:MAG TPA: regulatory protein RecX [Candidatus Acidoferrales bacterium]|nr:regulatory protein RecX [Candidatus Acidoferrales bacterium]
MSRSKADPPRRSRSNASETAWTLAVRWLAARDRSSAEVHRRLEAAGVESTLVEATLQRLRNLGYVDDTRFASSYAEMAARRGHGSERVRSELEARGVNREAVEAAIGNSFENERELAQRALARHQTKPPTTANERARAARFLLNRGFPEAVVLAIIGEGC